MVSTETVIKRRISVQLLEATEMPSNYSPGHITADSNKKCMVYPALQGRYTDKADRINART
jgi:hypothetical protein